MTIKSAKNVILWGRSNVWRLTINVCVLWQKILQYKWLVEQVKLGKHLSTDKLRPCYYQTVSTGIRSHCHLDTKRGLSVSVTYHIRPIKETAFARICSRNNMYM